MNTLIIGDLHGDRAGLLRLLRASGAVAGWAQVARCALPLAGGVMATVEEIRADHHAIITQPAGAGTPLIVRCWRCREVWPCDTVTVLAALDEAQAQLARDAPVLAAVARLMALHDDGCACQCCLEERQSGLRAAWVARETATPKLPPDSAPGGRG